jgi:hypothetical protein
MIELRKRLGRHYDGNAILPGHLCTQTMSSCFNSRTAWQEAKAILGLAPYTCDLLCLQIATHMS